MNVWGPVFFGALLVLCTCTKQGDVVITDCPIQERDCIKTVGPDNVSVTFDITPKPVKTMSKLVYAAVLTQRGTPLSGARVTVALSMPGMYMGNNRVMLAEKGKGRYEGEGVIIRCASGKKIWKADVHAEFPDTGPGKEATSSFIFEVKD
jgi:hypothetical protein